MSESQPRVCISILNWYGADKTIRCLESLFQLDYRNYHIIVVDNASGDDSVSRIRRAFPEVEIIIADTNLGFAGGHELALHYAQSAGDNLFWMLNNDAIVKSDTLSQLVAVHNRGPEALLSSVPLKESNDPNDPLVIFPPRYLTLKYAPTLFHRDELQTFNELFPDDREQIVAALPGSCILIPLSIIEQHGFMDTSFFMYGEEIDYCFRLHRVGVASVIVPKSRIFHEGGGSQYNSHIKAVITYYKTRNEIIKAKVYDGNWAFIAITFKKILRALYTIRYSGFMTKVMLHGILDGIRNRRDKRYAPEDYI